MVLHHIFVLSALNSLLISASSISSLLEGLTLAVSSASLSFVNGSSNSGILDISSRINYKDLILADTLNFVKVVLSGKHCKLTSDPLNDENNPNYLKRVPT